MFQLMRYTGCIVHQTYNQLYLNRDRALGEQAQHKALLGYHDIRFGTEPDRRLIKFLGTDLPNVLPEARERFERFKDLHAGYRLYVFRSSIRGQEEAGTFCYRLRPKM